VVLVILLIGTYQNYKKRKDKSIFLFTSLLYIFSLLTINIGHAFKHYFILFNPSFIWGCILIFNEQNKKVWKPIFIISILIFISVFISKAISIEKNRESKKQQIEEYRTDAQRVLTLIPNLDKNRIYYYEVQPSFYPIMQISTNYKYFILQNWHGIHDKKIPTEINDMMVSVNYPLWILIEKDQISSDIYKTSFGKILYCRYNLYTENRTFLLYKIK